MTVGFDVFVQDVIAAIATEPVRIVARCVDLDPTAYRRSPTVPATLAVRASSGRRRERRRVARRERLAPTPRRRRRPAALDPAVEDWSRWERRPEVVAQVASGTRSCGRRGPATDGTTVARSSSSSGVEVGAAARLAPQALLLGVALDQRDPLLGPAGQAQVGERLVVDREDRRRSPRTPGSCC